MLLLIEFLIVAILVMVLIALYVDEHRTRYHNIPAGKLTGYWSGRERRKDVRVDAVLAVRYAVGKKARATVNGITKNISTGGILIETSEKLLIEAFIGLEIELPNQQKPLVANGKVAWTKEGSKTDQTGKRVFDTGIRFVDMGPRHRELLLQHINNSAS